MSSATFTTTALRCRCGSPLSQDGEGNTFCARSLRPVGLCLPSQVGGRGADGLEQGLAAEPDDPVGARKPREEPREEPQEEPEAAEPFHPEPDCPRCQDTGLVRGGECADALCTCTAGEARGWEVRHG